jgi:uncharacterized repeat protein (TIGR01451 family)
MRVVLAGTLALVVGLLAATFASASHVEPVPGPDNPGESDCPAGSVGWKYEPVSGGSGLGDGTLSVSISVNDTDAGPTFDFSANLPIVTVLVKGGPVGNTYAYAPAVTTDAGLHAPVNPSNDKYYGLSHLVFCYSAKGTIIVEKQTNPNGDPQSFGFTSSFAGSFSLADGQTKPTGNLDPGTYSVSENVPAGWSLTSAVCDDGSSPGAIALAAGETVTCVFTNTKDEEPPPPPEDGRVVVKKVMVGGQNTFTFSGTPSGSISQNGGTISQDVEPGQYTSTEDVLGTSRWDLTAIECDDANSSGDLQSRTATFNVEAGETVTCTFENTRRGRIIVEKQTNPDGSTQAFSFDASYDADGFELVDGQQNLSAFLVPGTYSVSENVPAGWSLTSAVCDDGSSPGAIALAAGETVTCTFLNTQGASIIVEKQTNPDGASAGFSFSGDAAGAIADGGQIVVSGLDAGTYTSTEAAASGWNLTAIVCDDDDSSGDVGARQATFRVDAGETVKCTFHNAQVVTTGVGSIDVQKSATPTSIKEPGGPVTFSVRITNTSNVDITVSNVVDSVFGDLDDSGGNGCFDVPINMSPGDSSTCQFVGQVTGTAGTSHVNVVTATGNDEFGNPVSDSDDARVDITPLLIDLAIVKESTSPTPLNGTVNYTMTVTNQGPDTATNVQLADPAPAGITYLAATPSQGTCSVAPALVTCTLGTIVPGQTVTVGVTARATAVGTHVNTATVTGSGGAETNPADNVDSAQTVVPAPLRPPVQPTKPTKPSGDVCLALVVTPKMITADGKPDRIRAVVRGAKKPMKGKKVLVRGVRIRKTGVTNRQGVAVITINPRRTGLITITTIDRQKVCSARRIGVVGVFLPPVTG